MTLRTRVTLAAGVAVLLAVVGLSVAVHVVVRANLRHEVDESCATARRMTTASRSTRC